MRRKWALGFWVALISAAAPGGDGAVLAPPADGFVNEAHETIYTEFETAIEAADVDFGEKKPKYERELPRTLERRLSDLALTAMPDRVRELKKIVDGWTGADGIKEIGEEIPKEFAAEVGAHRLSIERLEDVREERRREEINRVIRKLDALATELESKPGTEEAVLSLRAEAAALMPRRGDTEKWGKLEVQTFRWKFKDPPFVRMEQFEDELFALAHLEGNIVGGGEGVTTQRWNNRGPFGLHGRSMQSDVRATAYALRDPRLKLEGCTVRTVGLQSGAPDRRVRLLHKSRGFCYLSGVSGYMGELTRCDVKIDPEDDFYYLTERFQDWSTAARAVVVEYPEGKYPDFEIERADWKRGDAALELLDAEDGVCLLAGISGILAGGGEGIRIMIDADGKWRLSGKSQRLNTGATVLVLRFKK